MVSWPQSLSQTLFLKDHLDNISVNSWKWHLLLFMIKYFLYNKFFVKLEFDPWPAFQNFGTLNRNSNYNYSKRLGGRQPKRTRFFFPYWLIVFRSIWNLEKHIFNKILALGEDKVYNFWRVFCLILKPLRIVKKYRIWSMLSL